MSHDWMPFNLQIGGLVLPHLDPEQDYTLGKIRTQLKRRGVNPGNTSNMVACLVTMKYLKRVGWNLYRPTGKRVAA